MSLEERFVDTMRVATLASAGPVVDGERDITPGQGPVVLCALFVLNQAESDEPPAPTVLRRGTLLCAPRSGELMDGPPVSLGFEDELDVVSERQNVADGLEPDAVVRWRVDGQPVVLGPPGDDPIGLNVQVARDPLTAKAAA